LGGFVEVWLAKAEHHGLVGINLLTKVALPNLAVLYGAMQAGVDVVLMGAGIPREIPGALDNLARHEPARIRCEVTGVPSSELPWIRFDPADFDSCSTSSLKRPAFFPIISSNSLATVMDKKANGSIEGFVVEGPTAGGHNAPPRGPKHYDDLGQPLYTSRDEVDWKALSAMGYPFWMAGGLGSRGGLKTAQEHGATGIQVGTLFAYCKESGLSSSVKTALLNRLRTGPVTVKTDPLASPTGFPFKVVDVPSSLSDESVYVARTRICDLGYLREAFRDPQGQVQFRCAAEPVANYIKKGGQLEDTLGRKCLCNGLMAAAGFPQTQRTGEELPIVTSGDALEEIRPLLSPGEAVYCAQDVIDYLIK
jgi:NAD(P)H-dependent flavin oxidoreductase YrpB (nitropropane dioxygenase family)